MIATYILKANTPNGEQKRMRKILVFSLIYLVMSSCNNKIDNPAQLESAGNKYKNYALTKGDQESYGAYLELDEMPYEKLSVSLLMSTKYGFPKANYEVYRNLIELYNSNKYEARKISLLNTADRELAMHYLVLGAEKNEISSQIALEKTYRNGYGENPDMTKADSLYKILELSSLGEFYIKNRANKSKVDNLY